MGYVRHHAIIVTAGYNFDEESHWIDIARRQAQRTFGRELVSNILISSLNDYRSFFIAPDGSKEGWVDSDEFDEKRAEYVKWLYNKRYEGGSSPLAWMEIQYGDEHGDNKIVDAS